jgi:hypothetical protein
VQYLNGQIGPLLCFNVSYSLSCYEVYLSRDHPDHIQFVVYNTFGYGVYVTQHCTWYPTIEKTIVDASTIRQKKSTLP